MHARLLLSLTPVLLALACGTNDNTVASQNGSGATAGVGGGGGAGAAGGGAGKGGVGGSGGTGGAGGSGGAATGGVGGSVGGAGGSSAGIGGDGAGTPGAGRGGQASGGTGGEGAGGSGEGGSDGGTGGLGGMSGSAGTGGVAPSPCEDNMDCVVMPASCCGACGVATRTDVIALNQDDGEAYRLSRCANVACPGCAGTPDPTLVATCSDGFCAVVDLLEHELTACTSPSDCRVRSSGCCECGGESLPLLAVNPDSPVRYEELVCNIDIVCAACGPQYPPTTIDCLSGHCEIVP